MQSMTSIERIGNILRRQPVDRVGLGESYWGETLHRWRQDGYIEEGEALAAHFGYDYRQAGWPNVQADPEYQPQAIEETDEWPRARNAHGGHLKWWEHKCGTPQPVVVGGQ